MKPDATVLGKLQLAENAANHTERDLDHAIRFLQERTRAALKEPAREQREVLVMAYREISEIVERAQGRAQSALYYLRRSTNQVRGQLALPHPTFPVLVNERSTTEADLTELYEADLLGPYGAEEFVDRNGERWRARVCLDWEPVETEALQSSA